MMSSGLPDWRGLLGQHARARARPRPGRGRRRSATAGWRRRRAWRAAWPSAVELGLVAGRLRAPPARRSCRGRARPRCARRPRRRRRTTDSVAARRSVMFSPIVAISCVSSPCTSRPVPGYGAAATLARSPPLSSASSATVATNSWNCSLRRDEVGLGIDLDDGAAVAVGGDADQALGGDAAGLLGGRRQALGAQPVDRASRGRPASRPAPSCNPSCPRRSSRAVP